jgi:hypothetical protein
MSEPIGDDFEFSPEDGWSWYNANTIEHVEHSLKKLIHNISLGLDLRLFDHSCSDFDGLVEQVRSELHRIAETDVLKKAIALEFGFTPGVEIWRPNYNVREQ